MALNSTTQQAATFQKNLQARAPEIAVAVKASAAKARSTKPGTAAHIAAIESVALKIAKGLADPKVSETGAKLSASERKTWANQLTPSLIDRPTSSDTVGPEFSERGSKTTKTLVKAFSTLQERSPKLPAATQPFAPSVAAASTHAALQHAVDVAPAGRTAAVLDVARQTALANPTLTQAKVWAKAEAPLRQATDGGAAWVSRVGWLVALHNPSRRRSPPDVLKRCPPTPCRNAQPVRAYSAFSRA